MSEHKIFKCSTCQKLRAFEIHETYEDVNKVVAECMGCYRTGIKPLEEEIMTDKDIVRCAKCGAYRIQGQKCTTCQYVETGTGIKFIKMGGW